MNEYLFPVNIITPQQPDTRSIKKKKKIKSIDFLLTSALQNKISMLQRVIILAFEP